VAVPFKKRARRELRSRFLVALIGLLSRVPLRVAWPVGTLAGRLGWWFGGATRRKALAGLATAFPEKPAAEREAIGRAMMVHLAHVAVEAVTIRSFDAELESYVGIDKPELLREVMARGKGVLLVPGHIGNWEFVARRLARAGLENATIGRANNDARLTRLIDQFRSSGGVNTVWRESPGAGRVIMKTLREGKGLIILIDQDTRVQNVFVPFFGKLAATPRAVGDLALRFGAAVVVATSHRRGEGPRAGHQIELTEIPFDPEAQDREAEALRVTGECTRTYEEAIRRYPAEWVWMHERWKTRPPQEPASDRQQDPS
jgi:KDO2-lipid IV(A) lauroyltransferase